MHYVIIMEKGLLLLCTRRFDSSGECVGHLPIVIKSPADLNMKIICIITGPAFPGWRVSQYTNTSLFRTQASLLYLAYIVSHGKDTPYLARLVCPSNYGLCFLAVVHAIVVPEAENRKNLTYLAFVRGWLEASLVVGPRFCQLSCLLFS